MFDAYLAADIAIAAVLVLISLFVISKNSKARINRTFFGAVGFTSVWIIANYLSNDQQISDRAALVANHLTLFFSGLMVFYLAYFAALLCRTIGFTDNARWITGANYVVALLTLTPLTIQSIYRQEDVYAVRFGPLAALYFVLLAINAAVIIYSLVKGMKKSSGTDRLRVQTVFWSLATTLIIGLITNAILPIAGIATLSNLGALASVIAVVGLAYSIVKHRLFDIRAIVARSVAYLLSLGLIMAVFGVFVFGFVGIVRDTRFSQTFQRAFYVLITLALVLIYPPLKRYFDKFTNRLFYRDAYDSQEVMDRLSELLVGTVDLQRIRNGSRRILTETLRPASVDYLLLAERGEADSKLLKLLEGSRHDLIVYDELNPARHQVLRDAMNERNLAVTARLKTSHGNLGFMVLGPKQTGSIYTAGDIRLLGTIADEIAVGLQNALRFEEIQQFNVTLQDKVNDATRQLRHANSRLKDLDQTKDEFISMASHQLRTPLTSIKGYLSMVLEGDAGKINKAERQMIQQAFDSAERMVFLIADLLNVSRLQSGKFVIDSHPTDLVRMVEAEVAQLQKTAAGHHLTLTYQKPAGVPTLNLDETKLRQVVMNFIDNAIYYTPAGGSIDVSLTATDDTVSFTVTDTGLGVPKAEQPHLFTKFYRAGNARKMRPDGTGLGLFMAKKVIVAQGGTIIFRSTEGKGSTFGFSFPRAALEVKSPVAAPVTSEEPAKTPALV